MLSRLGCQLFSPVLPSNHRRLSTLTPQTAISTFLLFLRRRFCAVSEQFSDDEYNCDIEIHQASSSVANIDDWKWKLRLLLRNEHNQEILSREKIDKRDYEQISFLARGMGLYSEIYGNVVVASKVPLPKYRPDLDDERPQRQVVMPLNLQRRVEGLLQEHLDRMQLTGEKVSVGHVDPLEGMMQIENAKPFLDMSVMENIVQRRSLLMRNAQRVWQESPEGKKMLDSRRSLPSYQQKGRLLQAIAENQVIVVSGETGCGKTTQLPQYILESEIENGHGASCSIICTQPRRISAVTVAERVSTERGELLGESVGFKVRLEGKTGKNTQLLFCTSGILLRRLLNDRNLDGITHVFVDEIHERGMNEDFLLIILKDLLQTRKDLKLILMSATLNAELFCIFFRGAPKFHIPGFTFPVRTHFLEDVLEMTGYNFTSSKNVYDYEQEIKWKTCDHLKTWKPPRPWKQKNEIHSVFEESLKKSKFSNYSSRTRDSLSSWRPDCIDFNLIEALLCYICRKQGPGAVLVFMTGWEDIRFLRGQLSAHPLLGDPNRVLLLACHGSMATSELKLMFEKPPCNVRKIVLATNMAEASITINDIGFVIDCGKAKETTYDALNNTPCLLPSWISQASARQRRGRAGRVQPGECYHLYPKCMYEVFAEYQLPELLRTPLNSLCLQIKSLKLGNIQEFLSAALQPPEPLAVKNAVNFLKVIGALDENENLTNLGQLLSVLPVDPKLGKMLIMGAIFRCYDPVETIVAGLSVREPFVLPPNKKDLAVKVKSRFSAKDCSDHMAIVRAFEGWKDAVKVGSAYEYCWQNFLYVETLQAIQSIRNQFSNILKNIGLLDTDVSMNNRLSHNQSLVRAITCSGLFPGVVSVIKGEHSMYFKTMDDGQVSLHVNSVNAHLKNIHYPWLVFCEKVKVNNVFIRDSTGVSDSILLLFGGSLSRGIQAGHLKMLGGNIDFFMDPSLADCFWKLKEELNKVIQKKLEDPRADIHEDAKYMMLAVQELILGDPCEGNFVFGRDSFVKGCKKSRFTRDGRNPKTLLSNILDRAGHMDAIIRTKQIPETGEYWCVVKFKKLYFAGKPNKNKQAAEFDACAEALTWLTHTTTYPDDDSLPEVSYEMLDLLHKYRLPRRRAANVVKTTPRLYYKIDTGKIDNPCYYQT